jgi:uncharacterized protein with von Willebrand factor type A (vWA) domain
MSAPSHVSKKAENGIQISEAGPARAIVEFCRFGRAHGLSSNTKDILACLQALRAVKHLGFDTFKFVLRTVLCSSKEEWGLFDTLFAEFWQNAEPKRGSHSKKSGSTRATLRPGRMEESRFQMPAGDSSQSNRPTEDQGKGISGASAAERLRKIDFAQVPQSDLAELERLSRRLLQRLSCRISRRFQPRKRRGIVDLRKTIRMNLGRGGDPIELSFKKQKRHRAKLVILLDVSDSMNPYSLFLFKFVYVLRRHFREVTSFIFSTNLVAVSEVLRAQHLTGALKILSRMTTGWSGGTRIGGSLEDFNRLYAGKLLSPNTALIILSDGWDTGGVEVLVTELQKIKRRISKLIWLNPLLGLEEYEPVTRGMSAALPYIDVFAPAHNLESLLELERHLMVA